MATKLTDLQVVALRAAASGRGAWDLLVDQYRTRQRAQVSRAKRSQASPERSASLSIAALCRRGLLARNLHFGVSLTDAGRAALAAEARLP